MKKMKVSDLKCFKKDLANVSRVLFNATKYPVWITKVEALNILQLYHYNLTYKIEVGVNGSEFIIIEEKKG